MDMFYAGQTDYIQKLNELAARPAGISYAGLSITLSGAPLYLPWVCRVPMAAMDSLDGTMQTPAEGKAIEAFAYEEAVSPETYGAALSTLTAITFNDLVAAGRISFAYVSSLEAINLPELQGLTGNSSSGATPALGLTALPNLTTVTLPKLRAAGAPISISNSPLVSGLDMPEVRQLASLDLSVTRLATLNLPKLVSIANGSNTGLQVVSASLTTLNLPELKYTPRLSMTCGLLATLSAPKLESVGVLRIQSPNDGFTTLSLPLLKRANTITVGSSFGLATVSLPSLVQVLGQVQMPGLSALTDFSIGAGLKAVGGDFRLEDAALTQASVDNVLIRLAALNGTSGTTTYGTGRTVFLNGGTSAAPSSTGATAKATLQARGVTVYTN